MNVYFCFTKNWQRWNDLAPVRKSRVGFDLATRLSAGDVCNAVEFLS